MSIVGDEPKSISFGLCQSFYFGIISKYYRRKFSFLKLYSYTYQSKPFSKP